MCKMKKNKKLCLKVFSIPELCSVKHKYSESNKENLLDVVIVSQAQIVEINYYCIMGKNNAVGQISTNLILVTFLLLVGMMLFMFFCVFDCVYEAVLLKSIIFVTLSENDQACCR